MKKYIPYLVIIGLIVFLSFRECTRPGPKQPDSDTTTITTIIPGDSIPYKVVIEKKVPVPVYIETNDTFWRDRDVDTAAILADYFSKVYYSDTLMDDTSAFIALQSHVTENRLHYDELLFQNRRIKQITTTTIINQYPDLKTKWFIGGGVNLLPGSPGLSADLLIVTKKKISFEGGYDFINKMATAKAFYLISLRKARDGVQR